MVDITEKKDVIRRATASGMIKLREETIRAIKEGRIKKGDTLEYARIAAILAVKRTPEIIPMCHQIGITGIKVDFIVEGGCIRVIVEVKSMGKTGVEMEAINGAATALVTIWDMVKYLEKDENGAYPDTMIGDIIVIEKTKGGDPG